MGDIHINSFKSVQIEILAQNTKVLISLATGFLCNYKERIYLVTNWHVVAGKNSETKCLLHHSGAIPGFFNLKFQAGTDHTESTLKPTTLAFQIPLYDKSDVRLWHEHPEYASKIDVVVLDVTNNLPKDKLLENSISVISYDLIKEIEKNELGVTDNVFIIGYINLNRAPNNYPIYKSASIASEPNIVDPEFPVFYVDGKTKSGMSGSPVVKKHGMKVTNDNGGFRFTEGKVRLVGVYSGREKQGTDEYEAELGIVWKFNESVLPILESI